MSKKSHLFVSALISMAAFSVFASGAAAEDSLEPITPSDYLVENIDDYITVEDLDGLEVTQYTYEITDEDVSEEALDDLGIYEQEEEVDRSAQEGDVVYVTVTETIAGGEEEIDETYFYLGDEEYGPEFDAWLIGAKAGDTLSFEISYTEEDADELLIDEEWANQTVSFVVDVESVCELVEPDYTDDYVAENSDYDTIEEYEEAVRVYLEEEFEEISYMDVFTDLMDEALTRCTFTGIPDDLYEDCRAETLESYAMFADTDVEEEILDLFGMTEDDLDEEIADLAQRRLLISYLCEKNEVELTEEDYTAYVEAYAEYYDYDSVTEFEEDMDRSYLVWSLYESMACEILYENADITFETSTLEDYYDWDWDDDDWDDDWDWDDDDWDDDDWDDDDWDDDDWDDDDWDDDDWDDDWDGEDAWVYGED